MKTLMEINKETNKLRNDVMLDGSSTANFRQN